MGVVVMEPLLGGNLASPIPSEVHEIWNEAAVKRTPAEWALRWIWNHPEVTVILSGMNQESHIEENLILADKTYPNSLTEAEIQLVSRVEQKYRQSR
jgi:predicted aldo/keto reductase-like oxidoreductase